MKILVLGGTGKVGVPLIAHLLARGADVTAHLHSSARAHVVPSGARPVIADLVGDPASSAEIFRGQDAVFMLNKASLNETVEGTMAVQLAREAGVRRFVYQTVHLLDDLAYLPHVAAKLAIKRAVELSGMDHTFIAPNHFFQNDESVRIPLLEKGLYLTPLGTVGCWCVDARDIAEAAAIVLTSSGHEGKSYNIVGPCGLTGPSAAAIWAGALRRPVESIDQIESWEDYTRPFMPAWLHYDLSRMYRDFGQRGMLATDSDVDRLTQLLQRPPRGLAEYAAHQAAIWLAG
jgi:uncharacterized protein YbjT (DUF2867 family)